MFIGESSIKMAQDRFFAEYHEEKETLRASRGNQIIELERSGEYSRELESRMTEDIFISDEAKKISTLENTREQISNKEEFKFQISEKDKQKISLLRSMIKMMSGKDIEFDFFEDFEEDEDYKDKICDSLKCQSEKLMAKADKIKAKYNKKETENQGGGETSQNSQAFFEYTRYEAHYEHERMDFSAEGIVKTSDGREININLNLHMSRDYASENFTRITNGQSMDPLIINYDGDVSKLSEDTIEFDLDFNGKTEKMSFLEEGSGFLAVDKNKDGTINDGSELFGAKSGDGFKELAKFDDDNNGWIDENDEIFNDLVIWAKDENGEKTLFALKDKGVGAIYLGNIGTDFNFKSQDSNALLGKIKNTGIFLKENGETGTVHNIDMVV